MVVVVVVVVVVAAAAAVGCWLFLVVGGCRCLWLLLLLVVSCCGCWLLVVVGGCGCGCCWWWRVYNDPCVCRLSSDFQKRTLHFAFLNT